MLINITWQELEKIAEEIEQNDGCPGTLQRNCDSVPYCAICYVKHLVNRMIRISNSKTKNQEKEWKPEPPAKPTKRKKHEMEKV